MVINLPVTECMYFTAAHGEEEKKVVYPSTTSWTTIDNRAEYNRRYPYMPERIIDNLLNKDALISVTNWDNIIDDVKKLRLLIELTYRDRFKCKYDLSRPMRRRNA